MKVLINIDVPNLEEAETFYASAFGLVPARRFGEEVVEMLGAETAIYLLKKRTGSAGAGTTARDYARHWMPMHADVVVEDLARALARALDAGALQEGEIREANWGRIVLIADPFGHGWCLLQFVGRGYDEITT
jgi:lactoylglutathione lyase